MSVQGRRVLLCVGGGIAAYKACELARLLVKAGAQVRVALTPAAQRFVTPLTFQALTGSPVATDIFSAEQDLAAGHIALADWAELATVAPATANLLARLRIGQSDDMAAAALLAIEPRRWLLAPAMNEKMWASPAVQENVRVLKERGARFVGPAVGEMAERSHVGPGRMSEPAEIFAACADALAPRDLENVKVLVTAGPTREMLDPVRYLSNPSPGRMGYATAAAARDPAARVTLTSGPGEVPRPAGVERGGVVSAEGLRGGRHGGQRAGTAWGLEPLRSDGPELFYTACIMRELVGEVRAWLAWAEESGLQNLAPPGRQAQQVETVKLPLLEAVRTELGECTRCKLHKTRTNIVFGVGNPEARLMFVGEGPGEDEDLQGYPFVGKAGQLLTKMIEAMGLRREDVYICNTVKCRPPNNRNPEPEELLACEPFLKGQLGAVKPEAIVTLGKFAAQALLREQTPITRLRGQWREYQGIPVMPTFHPAYLLRSPAEKSKVWEDLKQVMKRLRLPIPKGGAS